jgi:YtkA-like
MTMQRIGMALALMPLAVVAAYGSRPQASSQSGMHDGMQQSGSMDKGQKESTQEYKIALLTEPNPAKGSQENTFHISVTDTSGKPVSVATVKLTLEMPAMPAMNMAAMKVSPVVAWNGSDYSGKANVPSAGLWNVNIQVLKQNVVVASKKTQLMAK